MQHADTCIFKKINAMHYQNASVKQTKNPIIRRYQQLLKNHNLGGKLPLYQTPFSIFTNDLAEDKTSTAKNSELVNNTADKAEREASGPVSVCSQLK